MANDFNFGEFVIPLKFTADDFGDNVNPKVKRYLLDLLNKQLKAIMVIQLGLFGQQIQAFIFGKIWEFYGQEI